MTNRVTEAPFSGAGMASRRRQLGLSQEALARLSGVATVTVAKLEEGRVVDPRGSTLLKLAGALGCQVDALLMRPAPPEPRRR